MVCTTRISFGPSSNFGQYLIDSKCPIGKMIYQLNTNKKELTKLQRELPSWALYDQWLLLVIPREVFCNVNQWKSTFQPISKINLSCIENRKVRADNWHLKNFNLRLLKRFQDSLYSVHTGRYLRLTSCLVSSKHL